MSGASKPMSKKLRGAVYGCGMISEYHLRGWQRIPEVEIVALANRTVERAEERRRAFAPEARVYQTLGALLDREEVDFVDVLTPPALHREHVLQAKVAGVHVICQKPLCATLEDARALAQEMEGYGKLFAVHENHRYRPWFQEVLQRHRGGFFGENLFVHLSQFDPQAPPEAYKLQAERGVLLEYGTHLVDMVRALLGEPERVYARLQHANPNLRGESGAHVVFAYDGATVTIDVAWKAAGTRQGGVLVTGTRGEAFYEGTMTRGEAARFRLFDGSACVLDEARRPTDDYAESFYRFERACTDAMLEGTDMEQTAAENLRTLEATFAAYRAAERGEAVVVSEA